MSEVATNQTIVVEIPKIRRKLVHTDTVGGVESHNLCRYNFSTGSMPQESELEAARSFPPHQTGPK